MSGFGGGARKARLSYGAGSADRLHKLLSARLFFAAPSRNSGTALRAMVPSLSPPGANPREFWHRFSKGQGAVILPVMIDDDDFEPRLGRMRARGKSRGKKYLHRILAAANLAGVVVNGSRRRTRFDGSRIGRGSGVGRVLGRRDKFAAFRQRRVIVKSRIVKLAGKGAQAARAHLRYVERDGTTRDGGRGQLYGSESDEVDGKSFLARGEG
ncbi:MAG: hypothetical protein ACT6Q3_05020, partial [Sphingopyxis sp.]